MNNQTLVIYDFNILYEILSELEDHTNFKIIKLKKIADLDFNHQGNYLFISNKKIKKIDNISVLFNKMPINIYEVTF